MGRRRKSGASRQGRRDPCICVEDQGRVAANGAAPTRGSYSLTPHLLDSDHHHHQMELPALGHLNFTTRNQRQPPADGSFHMLTMT